MNEQRIPEFITQDAIAKTPMSDWYKYKLYCGHEVYTRVRLSFRASFNEHYIQCPQCKPHEVNSKWSPVESVEAVTNEQVSNVHDGTSFILPRRILRTDGDPIGTAGTGSPFPYASADRDY